MKKVLLVVILSLFAAINSFAQKPNITLGNIPNKYTAINGKESATKTTRSQMIASEKLVANPPGYEVKSYSVMIKSGTDIIYGPVNVKGARLTPQIIDAIKKAKGPHVYVYFDDIRVKEPDGLLRFWTSLVFTYDE